MATRERTRRAQQGQLDLGDEYFTATPTLTADLGDEDLQSALADISAATQQQFNDPDQEAWAISPYGWVKRVATVSRGKAATALLHSLLTKAGLPVAARTSTEHDLLVNGHRTRVKLSTLWAAGEYTFQQIRPGDYDVLVLLGLSPQRAHLWVVPKNEALARIETARGDTAWLTFTPNRPPDWLNEHGGTLAAGLAAAQAHTTRAQ